MVFAMPRSFPSNFNFQAENAPLMKEA